VEIIAGDAAWLMVFNGAIDHVIHNNPKAESKRSEPVRRIKRGLVNSLT
jgi:hypothetical protein